MTLRILTDTAVRTEPSILDQAWSGPGSFLFLPERGAPPMDWIQRSLGLLPEEFRQNHFILLTSGSTGQPKLVVGLKSRAESLARVLHESQRLEPVQCALVTLPLTYCFSFVNQWLWARVHHRKLRLTPGVSDPAALISLLRSTPASMLCMVGAQWPLLAPALKNETFPGVMRLNFAGGRFPQEVVPGLRHAFPEAGIFNNYGCAEAMPRLTQRRAEDAEDAANIGRPLPGVRLSTDAHQRLLFQSPYAAVGFLDADGFRPADPGAWMSTGDLAEERPDSSWYWLGRDSEVFKRFGEKIALPTILDRVRQSGIAQPAAYRESDPAGEEGYVLVLSGVRDKTAARPVLALFRDYFPRTHWPLRIEGVDSMPLLPNGKPDLRTLALQPGRTELWKQRL